MAEINRTINELLNPVIAKEDQSHSYDDHLKLAAQIADQFTYSVEFAEIHAIWTVNTQRRYENVLELFSTYLPQGRPFFLC